MNQTQQDLINDLFSPAAYNRFVAVEKIKRINPNAPIGISETGVVWFDIQPQLPAPEPVQPGITININAELVMLALVALPLFLVAAGLTGTIIYCLVMTIF